MEGVDRCELNSDETMFCSTITTPIQASSPPPRNSARCATHIVISTAAPSMPSWIATARI